MLSHDVKLPRDHAPEFPDACVACGATGPGDLYQIRYRPLSFLPFLFPIVILFQSKAVATAPACPDCRTECRREARWRSWQSTLLFGLVAAAVILNREALMPESRGLRTMAIVGYTFASILPGVAVELIWPRAFDVTVYRQSIDYEFRDESYAQMFADLNEGVVT